MRHLILGGARSGKSAFAERLAQQSALEVCVLVTARARDEEMQARIARHRQLRPSGWQVIEAPDRLAEALRDTAHAARFVIVDCLTLWQSQAMFAGWDAPDATATPPASEGERIWARERGALLDCLPSLPGEVVLVSNEVGLGIVPASPETRRFRDEAGRLHMALAAACERVSFIAAGLPLSLKAPAAA